jgi:acetyl esterase/lipase
MLRFARLLIGLLSCLVGTLAILPAPTTRLWMLAIVVTEWGYLLAPLALLPWLWPGRPSLARRASGILGLAAALLALTPLLRAWPIARQLPFQLSTAFGPATTSAAPLRPAELLWGRALPPVQAERRVYASYGPQQLVLDIYQPPRRAAAAPGLLVVHGGSWQSGDPTQFRELNRYLAGRGYLVAALSYRLAPTHPFPAARDDVFAALAYLRTHSAELGLDPERLVLLGRSAGGQLALLAAYSSPDPGIRGVIAFYAPADLRYGYANPGNPRVLDGQATLRAYLGGTPQSAPAAYEAASPINFVQAGSPPTLLVHGSRDELVSPMHSELLAARLAEQGLPHLLLRLPWATHACDYHFGGPSGQLSTYAVEHFLAAVTREITPQ